MKENNIGKKILILGNGFDLAHGLPTKYADFLKFCKCIEYIFKRTLPNTYEKFKTSFYNEWDIKEENNKKKIEFIKLIKDKILEKCQFIENNKILTEDKTINEIHELISQNFWYLYFKSIHLDKNWMDFESEIKDIIKIFEEYSNDLLSEKYDTILKKIQYIPNVHKLNELLEKLNQNISNSNFGIDNLNNKKLIFQILIQIASNINNRYLNNDINIGNKYIEKIKNVENIIEYINKTTIESEKINNIKDFRNRLIKDIKKLIRALELYLSEFVESKDIINNIKKIEITNIETEKEKFTFNFQDVNIDYVITFNYTHIYEKIYNNFKTIFHIHGECIKDRLEESNTPVLGIDKSSENGNNTIFNGIRKQSQRDKNNINYEEYTKLKDIERHFSKTKMISEVHIFGHSFGIMDSYILKNILSSDATSIIVYCRKPKKYQISERDEKDDNITNIIGYDKKQEKREKQLIKYLTFTTREITPNNQEQKK